MIFLEMDLETLTVLRSVCRGARAAIDNHFEYSDIFKYAPAALRASLSIHTARWTTCKQLHTVLLSNACQDCGKFGAYLYLMTCERLCHTCITLHSTCRPLTREIAAMMLCLSEEPAGADKIVATTVPGRYKEVGIIKDRHAFISIHQAIRAKMRITGKSMKEVDK